MDRDQALQHLNITVDRPDETHQDILTILEAIQILANHHFNPDLYA